MKTEHEIAQEARRRGNLTGSLFFVPVAVALVLVVFWVLICILLTPGVAVEGAYGAMQQGLRRSLITFGMVLISVGFGALLWRMVRPSDAV